MSLSRLFPFLLSSSLLAGCAGAPPTLPTPILREKVYESPADRVWQAILDSLKGANVSLLNLDRQANYLSYSEQLSRHEMRTYVLEKTPRYPLFSYYGDGRGYVAVYLRPLDANSTQVEVRTRVEGSLYGRLYGEHVASLSSLTSSGKLERDFFRRLDAALSASSYPWLEE